MANLTRDLGGPRLMVKRDDCTGFALGGNKVRQAEYYIGDALDRGADTLITAGAVQSNHARVTAAAAARFGLACELQVENLAHGRGPEYMTSGNALLQRLFGARLHSYPGGENEEGADDNLERMADDVRTLGGNPYVIHLGPDHPPLGALGYVDAAGELLGQAAEQGVTIDAVVLPSGSAGTHAGMVAGLRAAGSRVRVMGICIRRDAASQAGRVLKRARMTAELIGKSDLIGADDVWVTDDYFGSGYGQPTPGMIEAVTMTAGREGLLLDPVYTGKAMAGLIGLVRAGEFDADATVVFLHTGGTPALFAYRSLFAPDEA
jgi:D-cysteine desulfhydrase family pyridoxal phosphate-dependent enzyme